MPVAERDPAPRLRPPLLQVADERVDLVRVEDAAEARHLPGTGDDRLRSLGRSRVPQVGGDGTRQHVGVDPLGHRHRTQQMVGAVEPQKDADRPPLQAVGGLAGIFQRVPVGALTAGAEGALPSATPGALRVTAEDANRVLSPESKAVGNGGPNRLAARLVGDVVGGPEHVPAPPEGVREEPDRGLALGDEVEEVVGELVDERDRDEAEDEIGRQ